MAYEQPELNEELSEFFTKLWTIDDNKCLAGVDYELDLQGFVKSARSISKKDWARRDLFAYVNEQVFDRPTYHTFRELLDNYETETGAKETLTEDELEENVRFIDAIMETDVMKESHKFLVEKALAPEEEYHFKRLLYSIWFRFYKRMREDRNLDSSGFEHVFVGETREKSVIGFHNWIQFYLQEKRGNIDYKGYFRRGTGKEDNPRLITIQFTWTKGGGKPIGSSFIGTSPEFEIAIYTICRLMRLEKTKVDIDGYVIVLNVHGHGKGIGSAFPIACDDN